MARSDDSTQVAEPPVDPADYGVIYVIGENGPGSSDLVKIGLAASVPHMRLRRGQFQTGNPRELKILHYEGHDHPRWVEYRLHHALAAHRSVHSTKNEWFKVRRYGEHRWAEYLAELLDSTPPGPMPTGTCALLHMRGRLPGSLVAVCRCGWHGTPASVVRALGQTESHFSSGMMPGGRGRNPRV